jgi:hypothetical protein
VAAPAAAIDDSESTGELGERATCLLAAAAILGSELLAETSINVLVIYETEIMLKHVIQVSQCCKEIYFFSIRTWSIRKNGNGERGQTRMSQPPPPLLLLLYLPLRRIG